MQEQNNADLPRPRYYPEANQDLQEEQELPPLVRQTDAEELPPLVRRTDWEQEIPPLVRQPEVEETPPPIRRTDVSKPPVRKHVSTDMEDTVSFEPPKAPEVHVVRRQPEEDGGYGAYEKYDQPERRKTNHSEKTGSASQKSQKQKQPRKKKKKHFHVPGGFILKRIIRSLLTTAFIIFAIYSAIAFLMIHKLEKIPDGRRTVLTGNLDESYVRNVLLIGTDSRDLTTERGRSDTVMLLSLNSKTKKIYLSSFMRDAYVEIPGYGMNKLNAAYSLGGAELLMDTLEQNFQVSIDDYLSVSFLGFAGIIDSFGGVKIDLSDAEADALNIILQSEVNGLAGDDPLSDLLEKGGTYLLNGKQALSYARIRYVGNADFERTSRQREVMTKLLENAKSKAMTAIPELISSAMPHLATNMTDLELYFLSLRVPFITGYQIEQIQIPQDGTYTPADIDGQSVLQIDSAANTQLLKETVYSALAEQ